MHLKKAISFSIIAGILCSTSALAYQHKQTISTTPNNSNFSFSMSDGLKLTLGGYLQADASIFRGDASDLQSGTKIPNAVLDLTAQYGPHWDFNLSYNLADAGSKVADGLEAANVDYNFTPGNAIEVGQFLPTFGLENTSDTPAITFIQMPLAVNAIVPAYSQGISGSAASQNSAAVFSVFGPGTQQQSDGTNGHSPYGGTLRIFFAPAHTQTEVLHFGLSAWWQQTDGSDNATFSTTPEANPTNDGTLINTGAISNTDNFKTLDGEFALEHGPWEAQAEYLKTWLNRKSGYSDPSFHGYYVSTSYFLTGESRTYNFPSGAFTGISRINNSSGAWQLAARYSKLDLKDGGVNGGVEDNISLGTNWYLNQHIEFMLNYIRANASSSSNGADKTANIGALQAQATF